MSAVDVKAYFKGEPQTEQELGLPKAAERYPWLSILRSIEPGTGREVIMGQTACKEAIIRLEKEGKIRKGEYYSISRTNPEGGRRHFFIVHRAAKK